MPYPIVDRGRAPKRANAGLAFNSARKNTESSIMHRLRNEMPHDLGPMDDPCQKCGALHWIHERPINAKVTGPYTYNDCCRGGKVKPPVDYFGDHVVPDFVRRLMTDNDPVCTEYRENIQSYNNALSFTSLGANVDKSVDGQKGVRVFRINGALTHDIDGLQPRTGAVPGHAQIYVIGGGDREEAQHRRDVAHNQDLNLDTIQAFQDYFYAINPFAIMFKQAGEILSSNDSIALKLKTMTLHGRDPRRYNLPTTDEVAMIVEGDGLIGENARDIILYKQQGSFEHISDLHTSYLALRYVVLFPRGQQGYDEHYRMPETKLKISQMAWFAYLLFPRHNMFSAVLGGGRLFQEFVVDLYVCTEHWRLYYVRNNQRRLRAAIYHGVVEAMGRNDLAPSRTVILPSTFVGGPRYMAEQYHDSMALVREFGMPAYFITMTTNPEWPEIQDNLQYGQKPTDRPDLVTRVFYLKAMALINNVTKRRRLGHCLSWVYAFEHQKRSLPHIHLLLIMRKEDVCRTADRVDLQVSADLPDPKDNPLLCELITKFMIHGPCNKEKSCWKKDRCRLDYPRQHQEFTTMSENSYPLYRRPASGRTAVVKGRSVSCRDVVPYSPYLLLRYKCHVNVEIPVSIKAIKYLYKYISKGHTRSAMTFVSKDEVKRMIDGRYISAPEACGRLLGHPVVGNSPAVTRLALHLEEAQEIRYGDEYELIDQIETGRAARTTLTQFFELAAQNYITTETTVAVRTLLYVNMPRYFTWNEEVHEWTDRVKNTGAIGRLYFACVSHGERYYLRILLSNVRGPKSFDDIKTVDGHLCSTYREAAHRLGLLLGDEHYKASLQEAAGWQTGHQLRAFFALMLKHSPPADPMALWIEHKNHLSDDCARAISTAHPDLQVDDNVTENLGLYRLGVCLAEMDMLLQDCGLPLPDLELLRHLGPSFTEGARTHQSVEASQQYVRDQEVNLNIEQKSLYSMVKAYLEDGQGGMLYLDGPGGTGKTFTINLCLHYAKGSGLDAMAVASSGTAAILLLNGKTAHSGFKVPLNPVPSSMCSFGYDTILGRRLSALKFWVWDEIAMQNKNVIECVDRSLRDLRGSLEPFGGILVLFSGDFRQTLPVIKLSNMEQQANASLKRSAFWSLIEKFYLATNMRLREVPGQDRTVRNANVEYGRWLLQLGNGDLQQEDQQYVDIGQSNVTTVTPDERYSVEMINQHFSEIPKLIEESNWLRLGRYYSQRCVLTPLNKNVCMVNTDIVERLAGEEHIYTSLDEMDESFEEHVTSDILNSYELASFPSHTMALKDGCPIILLRNLNLAQGLCNGTRMVVTKCGKSVLRCRITSGDHEGEMLMLPRIKLLHEGDDVLPVPFYRYQFPVSLAFCITINKAQGQSLEHVLILLPDPIFSHGQLYVALSRCTDASKVKVCLATSEDHQQTPNIVYKKFISE